MKHSNSRAQQKKPAVAVNFPDQVAEEEEEDGNSVFVDKVSHLFWEQYNNIKQGNQCWSWLTPQKTVI